MSRQRPVLHFTVDAGWMNDPHGINFDGQNYHLFFQYFPDKTQWESPIQWGHAVSSDLIDWREVAPAVLPENEVGCWSGSVVIDGSTPILFYTRPTADDWGHGQVIRMVGSEDWLNWRREPQTPLIDGPDSTDYFDFRDPQVRRDGEMWKLVIGGGIRDVGGAAFQYSSTNTIEWTYNGVLAQGDKDSLTPLYTGTIWECPQFIHVDDRWVMLISAMDRDGFAQVLYAIGDYDAQKFEAQHWGFFAHTDVMYATTTFHDKDGRPCAMSWLREKNNQTPEGSAFAGAQSVAVVMEIVDDRLVLTPHPDLDAYLPERIDISSPLTFDNVGAAWRIAVDLIAESAFQMTVAGEMSWTMAVDRVHNQLIVTAENETLLMMPLNAEPGVLDCIVDADILEVFWSAGEGAAAVRVPANQLATVTVMGSQFEGRLAR